MATSVAGSNFFNIGMPILPSKIGSPKQIAVVQIMIAKLRNKPPAYASFVNPKTLLASPHQMRTAMPFMNPEITMLGTDLTREPTRHTAQRTRHRDITISVMLMNLFLQSTSSPQSASTTPSSITAVTRTTVTAVIGAVGPLH